MRERIQTNGRCEAAEPARRHVRPGRLPRLRPGRRSRSAGAGKWDSLPAAHADVDRLRPPRARWGSCSSAGASAGRGCGRRSPSRGSPIRSRTYALNCEHQRRAHARVALAGASGSRPRRARGALPSRSPAWTKFAALLVAPLWLAYPGGLRPRRARARSPPASRSPRRSRSRCCCSSPTSLDAVRTFWDRTIGFQLERESPFSIWGWGQYHAARHPGSRIPADRRAGRCGRARASRSRSSRGGRGRSSSPR